MSDKLEKQLRKLRAALDDASRKGQLKDAVAAVLELERLEPTAARWPHKRGDLLRRHGSRPEAVQAYAAAAQIYMEQGFLPRAIAMAKVILDVDPSRTDVLERLDPSAARALHRKARPEAVHVDGGVVSHGIDAAAVLLDTVASPEAPQPAAAAAATSSATPPSDPRVSEAVIELDLSDVELSDQPRNAETLTETETEDETEPDAEAASHTDPDTELRAEAHRLASLPLFPLFAEIPKDAMLTLARESHLRVLSQGDVLLRVGDPAASLFGIVSGQLRVLVPGAGNEAAVVLGEGDVLGESCLLGDERRRADVVAESDALVLEIPKTTLNFLVRVHLGLGEVLLELLTRRLLGNLLRTAGPFRGLDGASRKQIASLFSVRRARGGTRLLKAGQASDALYITLTGHVEVERAGEPTATLGAGTMFGQQSVVGGAPSDISVRTRENQLVLVLPAASFSRIAMEHFQVLSEISALDPVARIAS